MDILLWFRTIINGRNLVATFQDLLYNEICNYSSTLKTQKVHINENRQTDRNTIRTPAEG